LMEDIHLHVKYHKRKQISNTFKNRSNRSFVVQLKMF
jgi:hypothetical protein